MTDPQLYTIIALAVYAIAMALIGCISFGKSKTLDGFLIGKFYAIKDTAAIKRGTVISLMEMEGNMGGMNFEGGERPSRPEGMEDFQGFGDFDPEDFDGTFPEGEMPEFPEGEMPERPENGERPEMPTGENGEMPQMPTGEGSKPEENPGT